MAFRTRDWPDTGGPFLFPDTDSTARRPSASDLEGPFELANEVGANAASQASAFRSTPEYVRWVQDALNRTLGTKLTVDGRGGTATRTATARFQRLHRLDPNGVVDPATEAALATAAGIPAPAPIVAKDLSEYVSLDFVLEDFSFSSSIVFSRRPAFRDLASLVATPAGALVPALVGGPIRVDPTDNDKFQTRARMQLVFQASAADPTRPAGSGRLPLAVLVHGQHEYYRASPTGTLLEDRESFRGYRYLQDELARAGIASISVDTNMANATASFIELRADLVLEALKFLKRQTSDPGSVLFNRFDFDRVALMGHSRGGDAVVRVVKKNRAAPPADRFGILTVCSLAPTDFTGGQVPGSRTFLEQDDLKFYSVLYGALDGDVSGVEGSNAVTGTGFRHYDRARCQKALVFAERCCHNSFNSVWHHDGVEDGVHPADRHGNLVGEATHQKLAIEYIGRQFQAELKATPSKTELFNGTTHSATHLATAILWSFGDPVRILDDFETPADPALRQLNAGAVISDFGSIKIPPVEAPINDHVLEQSRVVHAVTQAASGSPSGVETRLPPDSQNFSAFTTLALDIGAFFNTTSKETIAAAKPPTFSVILHDNRGAKSTKHGVDFSPSLRKPFFHKLADEENVTALHLETLKIPLKTFKGIDLRNVVKIQVDVSAPNGHLFIDDIKLARF